MWFTDIARKRPLPEAESQPPITPRVAIFHTMVGSLAGTEAFFRNSTSLEAHFGVGGPWDGPDLDGVIWQWMSTDRQADANLGANAFAISIETSDGGDPNRPWSAKQVAALIRLGRALADHYQIPRRLCPSWDQAGFGWHAMWGAPSRWTPSAGKTCPGSVRIAQLKQAVLPGIFAPEEDDMPLTEAEWDRLEKIVDKYARWTARWVDHGDETVLGTGNHHDKLRGEVEAFKEAVGARLDAIEELLTPDPTATSTRTPTAGER